MLVWKLVLASASGGESSWMRNTRMSSNGRMCVSVNEMEGPRPDADHCQEVRAEVDAMRRRTVIRKIRRTVASGGGWIFGAIALIVGLSIVAVNPVLQFMSLGYMLESG